MTRPIHENRKSRIEIQKSGAPSQHQQNKNPISQGEESGEKFIKPQDNSELKLFKEKVLDLKPKETVPWWERDPMMKQAPEIQDDMAVDPDSPSKGSPNIPLKDRIIKI
jgi:hypothetical protein